MISHPEIEVAPRKMCWGKRVSPEFRRSVLWIEEQIGLRADFLMACMSFETGGTFLPTAKNPQSSATGLIQFMDATVAAMVEKYPQLRGLAPNGKSSDLGQAHCRSATSAGSIITSRRSVLTSATGTSKTPTWRSCFRA